MATKQFNSRIQWKKDTSSNWTANNPVLLNGEIAIVITNAGDTRFKVGNGTSTYTQLPFQDEYVLNQIPDVSNFVIAEDPTGIVDTVPPTFDGHTIGDFVLQSQVVNSLSSTATNYPLSANQGNVLNQSVQQNSTDIDNIETEIQTINSKISNLSSSVNGKLNLSGGSLSGSLTVQPSASLTGQVRNIYCSTAEPTASDGTNGDIWIVYGG